MDELVRALLAETGDAAAWDELAAQSLERRRQVVLALKAEVDRQVHAEPPRALAAAGALVRAAEGLPELLPLALRGRAAAAHFNGRHAEGVADFERALALHLTRGEELEAARVRRSLVEPLQMLGRIAEALQHAEIGRSVLGRLGERRLLAELEVNAGNLFVRTDEYPAARAHYARARELFEAEQHELGLAVCDYDLGVVEQNANRVGAAAERFEAARARFAALDMAVHVADCGYALAYLESRRGRFRDAVVGLERARGEYAAAGKHSGGPLCDLDLAEIFLRLDADREALEHAERAARAFGALSMGYERARALVLCGTARARRGDLAGARRELEEAAEAFRGLSNAASGAALDVQLAALEVRDGRPEAALARLERATAVLRERDLALLGAMAELVGARAHLSRGEPERAAAALARVFQGESGGAADVLVRTEALALRAEIERVAGNAAACEADLRAAAQGVEAALSSVPGRDVRRDFLGSRHEIYLDLAWTLAERGGPAAPAEALAVLERSRARSLRAADAPPRPESAELRAARERLDWLLARRLDAELGPPAGAHELRVAPPGDEEIRAAQRELAGLARAAPADERSAPREAEADLGLAAAEGEVVLAYLVCRHGTLAFLVEPGGVAVRRLPADGARLHVLRDRLRLHVDGLRLGGALGPAYADRARAGLDGALAELGRLLVAPLLADLGGRALTIVPFGVLHELPFHAFPVDGQPLVLEREVGYALSAFQLAELRGRAPAPAGPVRAVGVTGGRLAEIEVELAELGRLYGERILRIAAEELPRLASGGGLRGGALHVASHGVFDARDASFSALLLGERLLLARDLVPGSLDLSLVVLSGCETARQRCAGADETAGMVRALLGAGARAVVGSLWAVRDEDAAQFVGALWSALSRGAPVRRAAAEAQRALLSRCSDPRTWAAFAAFGDPRARAPVSSASDPERRPARTMSRWETPGATTPFPPSQT